MSALVFLVLSFDFLLSSPPFILPAGAPEDAYDSIKYGSLIRMARCPDSPAGNFCPGPTRSIPCTPGFYCPINSSQPIRCPPKFYCSYDTSKMYLCPENSICPMGTVQPIPCAFLSFCPIGTENQPTYGLAIVLGIALLVISLLFTIKFKIDSWMMQKIKMKMEGIVSTAESEKFQILGRLDKTFDIEFQDIAWQLDGKTIVENISGNLKSGRMCAIMGPSGSGKTTFVNLLTGKLPRSFGTVKINGNVDELSKYKKLIGFVPQDDVMLRELTVFEVLMHSARMRLPREWSCEKIRNKVLSIMTSLGIAHVCDSVIGSEEQRGISGGQRKRVNIGMELVAEPSILFLDEPTSGLDSSTAFELCQNLRKITNEQQLTVAAVIHSPSPATFKQFHDLMLLGKGGRLVYFGSISDAPHYFEKIGYPCPSDESLPDYLMDIVNGKVVGAFPMGSLYEAWNRETGKLGLKELSMEANASHQPSKYSLYMTIRTIREWFADIFLDYRNYIFSMYRSVSQTPDPVRDTCSFYLQFWFLMRRAYRQNFNKPLTVIIDVVLHFGIGAFIGIAINDFKYLGQFPPEVCISQAHNLKASCLLPFDQMIFMSVYVCMGVYFAGMSAGTATFGREKVVYWRDSAAGMSAVPYYLAKVSADIPRILVAGIMNALAISYMFNFVGSFAKILLLIEVLYASTFALGYFISIVFPLAQAPLLCAGFALLFAMVLSGATPSLDTVYSNNMGFLWDTSAARWATEALWIEQVGSSAYSYNAPLINQYKWDHFYPALAYILLIGFGWNLLTFFSLKLLNRSKQK